MGKTINATGSYSTTLEEEPVVVFDVFPADVSIGAELERKARVLATSEGHVYVFVVRNGAPHLLTVREWEAASTSFPGPGAYRTKPTTLAAEGDTEPPVVVNPTRGCGCSSPLKGWNPWPIVRGQTPS